MQITRDQLSRMFPHAQEAWLSELVRLASILVPHYRMNRQDWVFFCGQIDAETNGLSLVGMTENMRFLTASRIKEVYRKRLRICVEKLASGEVTEPSWARGMSVDTLARSLVGKPEELARIVYGGREGTPWYEGHLYIGRGPFQITHLNNYRAIQNEIASQPGGSNVDIVAVPNRLTEPEMGIRSAFADWHLKGMTKYAQNDDVDAASAKLNTGSASNVASTNGLDHRRRGTARAKGIWPIGSDAGQQQLTVTAQPPTAPGEAGLKIGDRGDRVRALQERLVELGYPVGAVDGTFGILTQRAVVAIQVEHNLKPDGLVGKQTMDVIGTTAPADLGDRSTATSVPGSQQEFVGKIIERAGKATVGGAGLETVGQAFDVSPLSLVMNATDHVAQFASKFQTVGMKVPTKALALMVAVVIGIALYRYGSSLWKQRLEQHRRGLNVAR
jgi:predicted chitinase